MLKMSDNVRVCQFYLRGRCKREKCEFKHPQELVNRPQQLLKGESLERSRSKDRKVRIYESDEDRIDSSDDDSEELRERQRRRDERVKVVKCLSLLFIFFYTFSVEYP